MKKEALALIILVLALSFASARINVTCSDGSKVNFDQNEMDIGAAKTINGLGIGLARTELRVFYKRVMAELLVDAKRVELSNKTSSEEISLLSGKSTVSFTQSSDSKATIKISDESKEMEEKDIVTIKGIIVMLAESNNVIDNETIAVKLIAGSKQISLSNDLNPAEKATFGNTTYLVELTSASESNGVVTVSTCKTGEISYENLANKTTTTNPTTSNATEATNTTTNNATINNETTTDENNTESSRQVTVAEIQERLRKLNESQSDNESETIVEGQDSSGKKGFFARLWGWIKGLFGF